MVKNGKELQETHYNCRQYRRRVALWKLTLNLISFCFRTWLQLLCRPCNYFPVFWGLVMVKNCVLLADFWYRSAGLNWLKKSTLCVLSIDINSLSIAWEMVILLCNYTREATWTTAYMDRCIPRDWLLIMGSVGGGLQTWGGACEVLPVRKGGGGEKVLAMLKGGGGTTSFGAVCMW